MSDALSLRVNTIAEFEAFLLHASVCVLGTVVGFLACFKSSVGQVLREKNDHKLFVYFVTSTTRC